MKEINNYIKSLLNNSVNPITFFDINGICTLINIQGAKNLGGAPDDFIGKSVYELLPRQADLIMKRFRSIVESGKGAVFEDLIQLPAGDKWFWSSNEPVMDSKGDVSGIQVISYDITDRKKTEEMLKESEKKYRQLVDNSMVGIYKTNLKGGIIYINKAILDLLEFDSPEEMMKVSVLNLYKSPKDRENLIKLLMKTGYVSNFETELVTKSGKTLNVILSASIEGDVLSGMMMDVSEQRHAEKAVKDSETLFSSILESIQDGVVVLDRDFHILYANKTYAEQVGTSFDVKGKHCYSISYSREEPCFLSGLECSVKKVFETGVVSRETRKKFDKQMEMTVYPLKDSSGSVMAVVEIRRDVTKHVQLDSELKNRIKELEEFYDMAVGREMRMRELKKEMGELRKEVKKSSN